MQKKIINVIFFYIKNLVNSWWPFPKLFGCRKKSYLETVGNHFFQANIRYETVNIIIIITIENGFSLALNLSFKPKE